MKCCLLRDDGSLIPLPSEDGSAGYVIEQLPWHVKPPGKSVQYTNPKDVRYERYLITGGTASSAPISKAFVYSKRPPTAREFAEALTFIESMSPAEDAG